MSDKLPPPPRLSPATSPAGALADLAGAVGAYIQTRIENDPQSEASLEAFMLIIAYRQFLDAGFQIGEAQRVQDHILETMEQHKPED